MIPIAQKISLSLMTAALVFFFMAYYHNWYMGPVEFTYTKNVVAVTSALSTKQPAAEPVMTSEGFHLNEYGVIIGMFGFAVLLALSSALLTTRHRLKHGKSQLFVPITFVSLCIAAMVLKVGYDFRLFVPVT